MFPEGTIYTLVHEPGSVHEEIERHPIVTSVLSRTALSRLWFRAALPMFPKLVEAWDFTGYDLVLSSSHCVAKGICVAKPTVHVAYIHTPMRYLWDQLPMYLPKLVAPLAERLAWPLRQWDVHSAQRPDVLLCNSRFVAERIQRVWGRTAEVVYPPVDVEYFASVERRPKPYFLCVSALVPYKNIALAVRVASTRKLPLVVVGDGPERKRLQRMSGPTIEFVGWIGREELRRRYSEARALWYCAVEDFGIVPVEAMAAGCPVIALGVGGVCDTVIDAQTGVLFEAPTEEALSLALLRFSRLEAAGAFLRPAFWAQAQRFAPDRFRAGVAERLGGCAPDRQPIAARPR